jgi:hypothetical protein
MIERRGHISNQEVSEYLGQNGAIMQLLMKKGADISVVGDKYIDALQAGASGEHRTAIRLLREADNELSVAE